ncbi:hypothetical protein PPYR_08683 [Photinus pyralis]|uniref:Uncharacterized protein n=1 Tax=Photinus pyralis TaxID=7054 RepID=A0A5N4AK26_PHOPY|nr:hypothetical protein PPYR_11086 [Photinus pyralis]KAB0797690.1 hypothetical protein PPYR_08683 [Photinus pyralis]
MYPLGFDDFELQWKALVFKNENYEECILSTTMGQKRISKLLKVIYARELDCSETIKAFSSKKSSQLVFNKLYVLKKTKHFFAILVSPTFSLDCLPFAFYANAEGDGALISHF